MSIFQIKKDILLPIKEVKIDLEGDIQGITEKNLTAVFGLEFVSTEFSLNQFRVDTLAFNPETNSFVIIEYKRDRSFSIIDQGYSYLSLMLNNKADFILEYNEKKNASLKRDDIDWSQSRVIFVANSFTTHQQNSINFKDLPFEIWEVKKFENDIILYNQVKAPESSESIKVVAHNETIDRVSREVKSYTVEEHFPEGWGKSRELFEVLREKIFNLDSRIQEVPVKGYIGYKIDGNVFVAITARTSKLRIDLCRVTPDDINDPEKIVKYRSRSMEFYNKHISEFFVEKAEDLDYAIFLIQQVYRKILI